MPEIWFAEIVVKTRIASVSESIICVKKSDQEMQADKHVAAKLLRLEKQGFKGIIEKDKVTGNPKIIEIRWLKYLSDTND